MGGTRRQAMWLTISFLGASCGRGEQRKPGNESPTSGENPTVEFDTVNAGPVQVVGSDYDVARVVDLELLKDGNIVILNSTEPYTVALSPEGSVKWSWGRRGDGPGEFIDPGGLVARPETGEIWAYDQAHHAFTRVGAPTEEHPTFTLQFAGEPAPPVTQEFPDQRRWMTGVPGGIAMAWATNGVDVLGLWSAEIRMIQPDGKLVPFFSVGDQLADPLVNYQGAMELLPYPLWAVCPDQTIAIYDPDSNAVRRYSATGQVLEMVRLPPEKRLEVSFDRVFQMIAGDMFDQKLEPGLRNDSSRIKERLRVEWERQRERFWKTFPEYYQLDCPSNGVLWLQPFDVEPGHMGRGPIWYRVSGGKISALKLDAEFRPYRFTKDRIWGTFTDEAGDESVGWIALEGPAPS